MSVSKSNVFLASLALLSLLPFLVLVLFWHPVGTHAFDWLSNWGGQFNDVSWLDEQKLWYTTTMGRYTSTGLLSTTSDWYTLARARGAIVLLLLALPFSLFYLLKGALKISYAKALGISSIMVALWLGQLANPYDTLYRWSGLLTYQTGLVLSLFYAGALVRRQFLLASLFVALAVGTNEISLVHCGMLTGAWLLFGKFEWRKPEHLLLLFVAIICAVIALGAPGNFERSEFYLGNERSYSRAVYLTIASSIYLWLGWLGSGMLILFGAFFWIARPPKVKMPRTRLYVVIACLLLVVPLSLAPVLIATRGDSLPEGITDWQIIPVLLLTLLIITQLPKPSPSKALYLVLGTALLLPPLFGGLGIDRSREVIERSAVSRIMVSGRAGNAWLQLLSGTSAKYDRTIEKQYERTAMSTDTLVYVPCLSQVSENYLYDQVYDRRTTYTGEVYFGYVVGKTNVVVKCTD